MGSSKKEETKKLDEIKPQEEYFLTDNATVMAILGIPSSKLEEEEITSVKFGDYKRIDKKLLKANFLGDDRIIFPSGTKISKELFEKAKKTANAWGCETEDGSIEFYEAIQDGKFKKDYPVMIAIDMRMAFLIAPIVDSEEGD
jgi:hypothetical protein